MIRVDKPRLEDVLHRCRYHVQTNREGVGQPQYELLIIRERHTVVQKKTMVVHFQYAYITHPAMMRPVGSY